MTLPDIQIDQSGHLYICVFVDRIVRLGFVRRYTTQLGLYCPKQIIVDGNVERQDHVLGIDLHNLKKLRVRSIVLYKDLHTIPHFKSSAIHGQAENFCFAYPCETDLKRRRRFQLAQDSVHVDATWVNRQVWNDLIIYKIYFKSVMSHGRTTTSDDIFCFCLSKMGLDMRLFVPVCVQLHASLLH